MLEPKPAPITNHAAIVRALAIVKETLIVKPSMHQRLCKVNGTNLLQNIGNGVFSFIQLEKSEVICDLSENLYHHK